MLPDLLRANARVLAVLVAPLSLAVCSDSNGVDQGSLSILLTDAPGDFQQAIVTIDRIELVGQGDPQDGPGTVLRDEAVTTNLLSLSNEVAMLVEEFPVSAGMYSQLRFIISGGCVVVEDEGGGTSTYASDGYGECGAEDGTLQMPSFAQTGIKVNLPGGSVAVTGEQKILVVDFDVSQSFGQGAGSSGGWVLHPVLTATDLRLTAGIAVAVSLADGVELPDVDSQPVTLADFVVEATSFAGDPEGSVPLTDAEDDGVFEATLQFLDPSDGPFSLAVTHADIEITTEPASPVSVAVSSGEASSQVIVVTSATLP